MAIFLNILLLLVGFVLLINTVLLLAGLERVSGEDGGILRKRFFRIRASR